MIWEEANRIAQNLAGMISPGCVRLEVVGSVKRHDKPDCHDIEILVIPNDHTPRPEFGQKNPPRTLLDKTMNEICQAGVLRFLSGGDRLRKYSIQEVNTINPFKLELYIVRPETWGVQNVIRTGPSLFSHRFVTNRSAKCYIKEIGISFPGLLPDEYTYVRGDTQILRGAEVLSLPEESDALALIGRGWIEPRNRINVARRFF